MANPKTLETPSVNIIGAGTIIEGDIKSDGDIRIDGTLNGSLITKGKLVLGTTGLVDGEVACQNADISGTITGKVKVAELLSLKATSKLTGDITTNKLSIEPGANFSGSCVMAGTVPNINLMSNNGQGEAAKSEKAALTDYGKYSAMALQMGATIGLGVWGGMKLDEYFGLKKFPAFTLFLSLLSVFASMYYVVKDLTKK